jgi:hypothetical protein
MAPGLDEAWLSATRPPALALTSASTSTALAMCTNRLLLLLVLLLLCAPGRMLLLLLLKQLCFLHCPPGWFRVRMAAVAVKRLVAG